MQSGRGEKEWEEWTNQMNNTKMNELRKLEMRKLELYEREHSREYRQKWQDKHPQKGREAKNNSSYYRYSNYKLTNWRRGEQ